MSGRRPGALLELFPFLFQPRLSQMMFRIAVPGIDPLAFSDAKGVSCLVFDNPPTLPGSGR
jgi:hypothetical protein